MPGIALVGSIWKSGSLFFRKKADNTNILTIAPEGIRQTMSVADIDAQAGTLTAARIKGGIIVHTSTTGGGNLTMDTGANIDAAFPGLQVGEVIECYVINDGNQIATLAVATGVTIADTGQTIGENEAALLLIRKTDADTFVVYAVGA
jgi:hypothetical protein